MEVQIIKGLLIMMCCFITKGQGNYLQECQQITPRVDCSSIQDFACLCSTSMCTGNITKLTISDCNKSLDSTSLLPVLKAGQDTDALEIDGARLSSIPEFICNNMTSLEYLKVTNNNISSIPGTCFQKLSGLKYVYLQNNSIGKLSYWMFDNTTQLEVLDISNNFISSISIDAWLSIINSSIVKLNGNRINEDVLHPLKDVPLPRDVQLHLYDNPFKCGCDDEWIKTWIKQNSDVLVNVSKIICFDPNTKNSQPISEANDANGFFMCDSKIIEEKANNVIELAAGFVTILIVLPLGVVIFCLIVYRYRRLVYSRTSWHPFDREECDGESVMYDVYVSCSQENEEWVQNHLMKFLQANQYKVTWHREHLNSGHSSVYDNIGECIERSKRTLCILSKKYNSSDVCMFELNYTLNMDDKHKRKRTMVMVCDDFDSVQVDEDLQKRIAKYSSVEKHSPDLYTEMLYSLPLSKLGESGEKTGGQQYSSVDIPQNVPMSDYF